MFAKRFFAAEHGVENDEQLAHAGGEGRFRVFPARPQLSVKVLDDWIGTNRGDHGHVQDAPDLGPTTPDTTAAAQATAVAVKGRQSGQRGDLFAIKCTQLGQVREQGGREHLTDPGHRAEQLVALAPDGGLADQAGDFVVEPGEPLFEPADVLINAFVDHLGRVGPAILFRGEHLNQLTAAVHQGFERLGLRVSQRSHLGFDRLAKSRQHLRVERVGLGQLSGGASEVAHLACVDHCNCDPRRRQRTGDRDFQTAGRFDNHQVSGLKVA